MPTRQRSVLYSLELLLFDLDDVIFPSFFFFFFFVIILYYSHTTTTPPPPQFPRWDINRFRILSVAVYLRRRTCRHCANAAAEYNYCQTNTRQTTVRARFRFHIFNANARDEQQNGRGENVWNSIHFFVIYNNIWYTYLYIYIYMCNVHSAYTYKCIVVVYELAASVHASYFAAASNYASIYLYIYAYYIHQRISLLLMYRCDSR